MLTAVLIQVLLRGSAVTALATSLGSRHKLQSTLEIRSIAVLPLENLSKDPGQDYFADGITDALTTDLAQIGAIRVISRTSATHFQGSRVTLPEIGRQLNVDSIVEGSVARSNGRVRITAQLIDARSDRHLWARTYERDLQNVLALQDEVARDIAEEIRVKLSPQLQRRLAADRKTDPRAYDAYLRGRYLWNQRNAEATAKAIGYFQEAVRGDPDFAAAYSGLADCYWVGWRARSDLNLAEDYARKALSLQPDLAEGHVSLGAVYFFRYKPMDAGKETSRALELKALEGIAEERKVGALMHSPEWVSNQDKVAAIYEKSGLRAAQHKAAQFMESSQNGIHGAISVALQYGTVEDKSKVLQWLEQSLHLREGNLLLLSKTAPEFDFLHTDSRFQDLLGRISVPQ
jgi:TolB-like protein